MKMMFFIRKKNSKRKWKIDGKKKEKKKLKIDLNKINYFYMLFHSFIWVLAFRLNNFHVWDFKKF